MAELKTAVNRIKPIRVILTRKLLTFMNVES